MKLVTPADIRKRGVKAMITGVIELEVDGRPQIVLTLKSRKLGEYGIVLTREAARTLTRAFGAHPLVEKYFGSGKGLQ